MTVEVPIWCQPKVLVRDSQLCLVWVIGEGLNPEPDLPLDFILSEFKNIPAKERNTMTRNIIESRLLRKTWYAISIQDQRNRNKAENQALVDSTKKFKTEAWQGPARLRVGLADMTGCG